MMVSEFYIIINYIYYFDAVFICIVNFYLLKIENNTSDLDSSEVKAIEDLMSNESLIFKERCSKCVGN
jgi:hypothetical protein